MCMRDSYSPARTGYALQEADFNLAGKLGYTPMNCYRHQIRMVHARYVQHLRMQHDLEAKFLPMLSPYLD